MTKQMRPAKESGVWNGCVCVCVLNRHPHHWNHLTIIYQLDSYHCYENFRQNHGVRVRRFISSFVSGVNLRITEEREETCTDVSIKNVFSSREASWCQTQTHQAGEIGWSGHVFVYRNRLAKMAFHHLMFSVAKKTRSVLLCFWPGTFVATFPSILLPHWIFDTIGISILQLQLFAGLLEFWHCQCCRKICPRKQNKTEIYWTLCTLAGLNENKIAQTFCKVHCLSLPKFQLFAWQLLSFSAPWMTTVVTMVHQCCFARFLQGLQSRTHLENECFVKIWHFFCSFSDELEHESPNRQRIHKSYLPARLYQFCRGNFGFQFFSRMIGTLAESRMFHW